MKNQFFSILLLLFFSLIKMSALLAQEVPIIGYATDQNGQVELTVNSTTEHYYILKIRHDEFSNFEIPVSITIGQNGTTIITEPLGSLPLALYQVLQYPIDSPVDTDNDEIDDITEYENIPFQNPLNNAAAIQIEDGLVTVDSLSRFKYLSVKHDVVQWSEYLNGLEFVKFIIVDFQTDNPKTYFINSNTHPLHANFADLFGIDYLGDHVRKGHIIYYPTIPSNNGSLGTFAFNFSNAESMDFETVQRTQELLAAGMPFLENNLSYFIHTSNNGEYESEIELYNNSRVPVLFESDVYAEVDYWGLHQAEGYGYFRQMPLGETPNPRDIVLYDAIPNSLPRVGGIITSVIQTPLSHVNLRAIQNDIPNAFIRNPLEDENIADLLNQYVYFRVEQNDYILRSATLKEVNEWYENSRPTEEQIPPLNLSYTSILPLDEIGFDMFDGFGAKCTNIATMRTLGFPEGTIPDGFGIPFYFYQEFMTYNGFFEMAEEMMADMDFISDRVVRDVKLKELRNNIKDASMPGWMIDELTNMQASFPFGTSIRCRSSTNNEDLPGFSGAGLYDSKTQHPDEGHISKSIKQVYASLWNLKAFEERDFYRVNHYLASMGILCHPNYSEEKVNGVGVSSDPVYGTTDNYYLNSQLGENLITNPTGTSIPEEILLGANPLNLEPYSIIQRSNLIPVGEQLMEEAYLNQMRIWLTTIHEAFSWLYNAQGNDTFAMDIEYKITSDNRLIIKQARPWVSFEPKIEPILLGQELLLELQIFPNPATESILVRCDQCNLEALRISNILGSYLIETNLVQTAGNSQSIHVGHLPPGVYIASGISTEGKYYTAKFVKR